MWQRRQFAVLFSPRCVPRRVALPSKRLYPKWLWQLNFSQPRQLLWVLHTRGALPLRLTLHRCLQTDCGTFAGFPLHVHPAAAPAQFNADGTAGWPGSLREATEPDQNQQRRTNTRPSTSVRHMIDLRDKFLLMFAPFGQGHKSPQPFVICIIDDVWTVIYGISQTLACSRSAAVRIHSFTLFHININLGPAGFITYSHATNKLEVVFCQLFFTLVADCPHFCLCRILWTKCRRSCTSVFTPFM